MRFTLAIGAATLLAFASVAVALHQRAAAQQAADAQRDAVEAAARSANTTSSRQSAVAPSTTPPATAQVLDAHRLYAFGPQSGAPQGGFAYGSPPATYGSAYPTPYGPFQKDFASAAADPETQALMVQDQQLENEVQSLARQLTDDADDQQRTELQQKLSATLEKQFDAQQKLREMEISRIEARVQKLRDLVRKRTDSRRKIIDNRYEQLLNDAEGLGWNSASSAAPSYLPQGLQAVPSLPSATMPRSVPPAALPRRQ